MNCSFCDQMNDSCKVDRRAELYICSNCVQLLLNQPQEKLKRAYDFAIKKNCSGKAKALESFVEVNVNGETQDFKRNLVRKRSGRKIRLTRDKIRPQQAAF